jgi:hypothetical protein
MMTLTLELPQDLEQELASEATELGLPLAEYALRLLYLRPAMEHSPKTGAELITYWQNAAVIGTRKDIDGSREFARKLRQQAETRK